MSMISGMDYADCFVNSGTEEEENLLSAHLGIYDSHVQVYEEVQMDISYAEWCAEMEAASAHSQRIANSGWEF